MMLFFYPTSVNRFFVEDGVKKNSDIKTLLFFCVVWNKTMQTSDIVLFYGMVLTIRSIVGMIE